MREAWDALLFVGELHWGSANRCTGSGGFDVLSVFTDLLTRLALHEGRGFTVRLLTNIPTSVFIYCHLTDYLVVSVHVVQITRDLKRRSLHVYLLLSTIVEIQRLQYTLSMLFETIPSKQTSNSTYCGSVLK